MSSTFTLELLLSRLLLFAEILPNKPGSIHDIVSKHSVLEIYHPAIFPTWVGIKETYSLPGNLRKVCIFGTLAFGCTFK